jgi:hypothetical protein
VTAAAAVAGASLAWLGAALLVLSDERRGLALGLAILAVGLAVATAAAGQDRLADAALAVGGACAAALQFARGGRGWGLMPPGSTPRLIGSVVVLIVTVLVAGTGLQDAAGVSRLGALVVAIMATGRLLTVRRRWAALGAGSALVLGLGALGSTPTLLLAATVAVGLTLVDLAAPEEVAA